MSGVLTTLDRNMEVRELSWEPVRGSSAVTQQEIQVAQELLDRYVDVALRRAIPRQLEGGEWYADLGLEFRGVWADGPSAKECLDELAEVLEEWVLMKIADQDRDLPVVDDIDLAFLIR
jgi:predicted RNase H-like HicB family nuclease